MVPWSQLLTDLAQDGYSPGSGLGKRIQNPPELQVVNKSFASSNYGIVLVSGNLQTTCEPLANTRRVKHECGSIEP